MIIYVEEENAHYQVELLNFMKDVKNPYEVYLFLEYLKEYDETDKMLNTLRRQFKKVENEENIYDIFELSCSQFGQSAWDLRDLIIEN